LALQIGGRAAFPTIAIKRASFIRARTVGKIDQTAQDAIVVGSHLAALGESQSDSACPAHRRLLVGADRARRHSPTAQAANAMAYANKGSASVLRERYTMVSGVNPNTL
jgi:hypothetical protein